MYKAFITLLHKWHVAALLTMLAVPLSCTNDAPPMGNTVIGRDSLPVMTTYGVSKLRGNVVIDDKTSQSHLRTQELYWNMQTGEMASNVHTILKQPQQEIEGTWFRATMQNGRPTQYHIRQSRGFMPMGDVAGPQQPQPNASGNGGQTQADSTQQPKRNAPVSHPKTRRE